jgi:hypothetical protein
VSLVVDVTPWLLSDVKPAPRQTPPDDNPEWLSGVLV